MAENYFQFFNFGFRKSIDRILYNKRKEIFEIFIKKINPTKKHKILDVGITVSTEPAANFLENHYPWAENITALSLENPEPLKRMYPEITFIQGDGKKLCELGLGRFDIVYSHAVIEHVGIDTDQILFLKQLYNISSRHIFITTPDKFHPIEFHTALPLVHWLPVKIFYLFLKVCGKSFYASKDNLNLLSYRKLKTLCHKAGIPKFQITFVKFLLFNSNMILHIDKDSV